MSASFPIVGGGPEPLREATREQRTEKAPAGSFAQRMEAAREVTEVSSEPPPEVRAEVQAAARCADQLHRLGRQLRFEQDDESGRIRIEVRDLDGNVLRRVPPTEVFDFASGKVTR
jgi:uncharacterized FlaG/YvyC family protein